jgi:hypothetical protein
MKDLLWIHGALLRAQGDIDAHGNPQLATAWHELNQAQNLIRVAIESVQPVEIKEAA